MGIFTISQILKFFTKYSPLLSTATGWQSQASRLRGETATPTLRTPRRGLDSRNWPKDSIRNWLDIRFHSAGLWYIDKSFWPIQQFDNLSLSQPFPQTSRLRCVHSFSPKSRYRGFLKSDACQNIHFSVLAKKVDFVQNCLEKFSKLI